jgi:hypothetical protein
MGGGMVLGAVDDAARSKTRNAANDGRTGETLSPQTLEQRAREWCVMKLIGLAEENPDETLIAVEHSHLASQRPSSNRADSIRSHPAINAPRMVTAALNMAEPTAPSSSSRLVS